MTMTGRMRRPLISVLLTATLISLASAFSPLSNAPIRTDPFPLSAHGGSRRHWLQQVTGAVAASVLLPTGPSFASDEATTVALPEMKNFVDPLFVIRVPKSFFTLRRSAKGDLPDAKTGKGRRGSSIFSAGDMAKAEVVAIERFPTAVLLEENGIEATGDLSSFSSLGEPAAIANLISLRRERDKPGQSKTTLVPGSAKLSENAKVLSFQLKTEIDVQKPELLLEQYGVSELFRITLAKASLQANDGNLMAVFASALEQDFNGPDGAALQDVVDSFVALDQPQGSA